MAALKWMRFLIYPTLQLEIMQHHLLIKIYVGSFKLICQLTSHDHYTLRVQYWLIFSSSVIDICVPSSKHEEVE